MDKTMSRYPNVTTPAKTDTPHPVASQPIHEVAAELQTPHDIVALQRLIGNRAVQRLLAAPPAAVQRGGGKDEEENNEKRKREDDKKEKNPVKKKQRTMQIGGRSLRQTKTREVKYVEEKMGSYGNRQGTRTYEKALKKKDKAEKELGSGSVNVLSKVPYRVNGKRIFNGSRSGLTFTKERETEVYGRYKSRTQNGRTEYMVNGVWLPKKKDAQQGESYASIDHIIPISEYIHNIDYHEVEFEGYIWSVCYFKDAKKLYNDPKNLALMSQSENSSKSGRKDFDRIKIERLRKAEVESDDEDFDILDDEPPKKDWDKWDKDDSDDKGGGGGFGGPDLIEVSS